MDFKEVEKAPKIKKRGDEVLNKAAEYIIGKASPAELSDVAKNVGGGDDITRNDIIDSPDVKNKIARTFKIIDAASADRSQSNLDAPKKPQLRGAQIIGTLAGGARIYSFKNPIRKSNLNLTHAVEFSSGGIPGNYVQEAIKKLLKFKTGVFAGYTDSQDGEGALKTALRENLPVQVKSKKINKNGSTSTAGSYDSLKGYDGNKILVTAYYDVLDKSSFKEININTNSEEVILFGIDKIKIENTNSLMNSNAKIKKGITIMYKNNPEVPIVKDFYQMFITEINKKTAFKDIGKIISSIYRTLSAKYNNSSVETLRKNLEKILESENLSPILRKGGRNLEMKYKTNNLDKNGRQTLYVDGNGNVK